MNNSHIDIDKTKATLLFIVSKLGITDIHKLFKILYFADKKHLASYGRPILSDSYIAMKHGPVPSFIYDCIKAIRGDGFNHPSFSTFIDAFELLNKKDIRAKEKPDMDELSKSDIECLTCAVSDNKNDDFKTLSEKSHDSAWENVTRDDAIDIMEIAKSAGANNEMLKYIEENQEYHDITFQ